MLKITKRGVIIPYRSPKKHDLRYLFAEFWAGDGMQLCIAPVSVKHYASPIICYDAIRHDLVYNEFEKRIKVSIVDGDIILQKRYNNKRRRKNG